MNITPEIKAQLEEQKKQCIFCKIISGEMESKVVFEDGKAIALLDIYPAIKGHSVFMLKEHYPMPAYMPAEDFKHLFGLAAPLGRAIKEGMLTTGINIFIALGGIAGQQSPHFLVHFLPREKDDRFEHFEFKKGTQLSPDKIQVLQHNFPIMMGNHFQRNPAPWHTGAGDIPGYLTEIYEASTVLYEDEKVLCVIPKNPVVPGHLEIYSKEEEKNIEELSQDSCAHLFFAASLASTLVFEGLQAQGSNILVKSGVSDDNPLGKLVLHVFPRWQNDSLQKMMWQPKQPNYDLNEIKKRVKEETWKVKYNPSKKEEEKIVVEQNPLRISDKKETIQTPEDEIMQAIENLKK